MNVFFLWGVFFFLFVKKKISEIRLSYRFEIGIFLLDYFMNRKRTYLDVKTPQSFSLFPNRVRSTTE